MTTPRPPSRGAPTTTTSTTARPLRNALLTPSASHSSLSTRTPLAARPLSRTGTASNLNSTTNGPGIGNATAGGSISRSASLTGVNGVSATPTTATVPVPGYMRPTSRSLKRDTLAAELERDPQLSSSKRALRSTQLSSQLTLSSLERQLADAVQGKFAAEASLRASQARIHELESDRRALAEREDAERDARVSESEKWSNEKKALQTELSILRRDHSALQQTHSDTLDSLSTLQRSSSSQLASQASQLSILQSQVSSLEASLASSESHASSLEQHLTELQHTNDQLESQLSTLQAQQRDTSDSSILRKELSSQAQHTRTLEARLHKADSELLKLRSHVSSISVLEEKLRSAESRAIGTQSLRDEVARLQAELDGLQDARQKELDMSISMMDDEHGLSKLRHENARLLDSLSSTRSELSGATASLAALEERIEELRTELADQRKEVIDSQDRAKRFERAAELAEREMRFLRAMLTSYEQEQQHTAEPGSDPDSSLRGVSSADLEELHALLEAHKASNMELIAQLDQIQASSSSLTSQRVQELEAKLNASEEAYTAAKSELEALQAETSPMEEKLEQLEQMLFELRGDIGAGHHVPPGTRVLSMRQNPLQAWEDARREALERLRRENGALLERVRVLEEQVGTVQQGPGNDREGEGMVPRESWEAEHAERERLEDLVKQREKRLVRLQDIFKAKSAEFRGVISALLGVKLAFYPNGQVRVTSVYDVNASFVYQPSGAKDADGKMTMSLVAGSENAPEDLEQWMRTWVGEEACIPGLMATVTLDAYERWKAGEVEGVDDV